MEYVKLYWKRFWEHAKPPTRATPFAAGLDLYSAFDYMIVPNGKAVVDTGIQFVFPQGYYGRLAGKSGNSSKYSIEIGAGVIDSDYTGSVKAIVYNHSEQPLEIHQGKCIVQMILEKIAFPLLEEIQQLQPTERGELGFGSLD